MKKLTVLLFTCLIYASCVFAQKADFGKVTKDEILQTEHPIESEAQAAILYQEGKIAIKYSESKKAFEAVSKVYIKIKVYADEAKHYGDIKIPYYHYDDYKSKVTKIKAVAYNYKNGKIEESVLDKKAIYKETLSNYKKQQVFAIPNVKKGSVIEYKFEISTPLLYTIPRWYFQREIPCNESYYTTEIPEYFSYKLSSTGTVPLDVQENVNYQEIRFSSFYDASNDSRVVDKRMRRETVEYKTYIKEYAAKNTPALRNIPYVMNMDMYRSSILHELYSTQFPGSPMKFYTKSWNEIAKTLSESSFFGKQLKRKSKEFNALVDYAKDLTPAEKIDTIYSSVQKNFKWDGLYGIRSEKGANELIKTGNGSIADINLLLINLLTKAGVSVKPVVTKKRSGGPLNTAYPTITELDYVFGMATVDNKNIYLDATDPYLMPGQLPLRANNLQGIVIDGQNGSIETIRNPNKGLVLTSVEVNLDEEGTMICHEKKRYKNKSAYDFRKLYSQQSLSEIQTIWDNKNPNVEYSELEIKNHKINTKQINVSSEYEVEGCSEEIAGKIFIDPLLHLGIKKNPFTHATRAYPVFYDSKSKKTNLVMINIPDGYQVESLPEKVSIGLPSNMASYIFESKIVQGKIQTNGTLSVNRDFIESQHYESLKEFYNQVLKANEAKIVLTKI